MARTAEALIEPALLVWARRSSGVDVETAAKRAGVDAARLESWEAGDARPTVAQLRQLAKLYKRPLAIFYLPEPPTDYLPLRDYRRLPDAEIGAAWKGRGRPAAGFFSERTANDWLDDVLSF